MSSRSTAASAGVPLHARELEPWAPGAIAPRVVTARACVSPRVNSALPCVRGSMPARAAIGRTSPVPRPSGRTPSRSTSCRMTSASTRCAAIHTRQWAGAAECARKRRCREPGLRGAQKQAACHVQGADSKHEGTARLPARAEHVRLEADKALDARPCAECLGLSLEHWCAPMQCAALRPRTGQGRAAGSVHALHALQAPPPRTLNALPNMAASTAGAPPAAAASASAAARAAAPVSASSSLSSTTGASPRAARCASNSLAAAPGAAPGAAAGSAPPRTVGRAARGGAAPATPSRCFRRCCSAITASLRACLPAARRAGIGAGQCHCNATVCAPKCGRAAQLPCSSHPSRLECSQAGTCGRGPGAVRLPARPACTACAQTPRPVAAAAGGAHPGSSGMPAQSHPPPGRQCAPAARPARPAPPAPPAA